MTDSRDILEFDPTGTIITDCKDKSATEIIIPTFVKGIGNDAFLNCESFLAIEIPITVKTIGDRAFCGCRSMERINIPDSVTSIGDDAFKGCLNLVEVLIQHHDPQCITVSPSAFEDAGAMDLLVPYGAFEKYVNDDRFRCFNYIDEGSWKDEYYKILEQTPMAKCLCPPFDKAYVIPYNTELSGKYFRGCGGIECLMIDRDFDLSEYCESHFVILKRLREFCVMGESPYFTENGVLFYDTRKGGRYKNFIEYGFLDGSLESLDGVILVAFPPCWDGKEYVIPEGVIGIACSAFVNCKLESLTIPESMRIIGCTALYGMHEIKHLYVPNKIIAIDPDHYELKAIDFELHPLNPNQPLDDLVVAIWNDVRRREPRYSEMRQNQEYAGDDSIPF